MTPQSGGLVFVAQFSNLRLREEKQKAQLENLGRDELQKRIADMSAFLQEQPTRPDRIRRGTCPAAD